MNIHQETTVVNSNHFTPIFLLQNPGQAQAANYFITVANVEQKPACDNLKSFYEKSGNIDGSTNTVYIHKPRILKRTENIVNGNSLKLASFLLPKNDSTTKPYIVNNFVLKPDALTNHSELNNTVPRLDINRRNEKVKDVPIAPRYHIDRMPPKIKPKEITSVSIPAKLTSVKLLKLEETYYKSEPEVTAPEPACDPAPSTKVIYKLVPQKDLAVVKKNIATKEKREEKKHNEIKELKRESVKKNIFAEEFEKESDPPAVAKVTRSGRTVKLPKLIVPEETRHKPKKRNSIVTCFQCSMEFSSLYRLQKHYENHPTHIPAKTHSNLFHCLLAIVKGGSQEDRTNIFIQQLEQLIVKLKSLLPCLLNKIDGMEGKSCTINDDVGRIFGMDPGKYNIDVNALSCVKDKYGFCVHNPPAKYAKTEINQPSQIIPNETISPDPVTNNEDCARISSAKKWPTVHKRVWKLKKLFTQKLNPKKMKLEHVDNQLMELESNGTEPKHSSVEDNDVNMAMSYECDDILSKLGINSRKDLSENTIGQVTNSDRLQNIPNSNTDDQKTKGHIQFHSTHFDIRSSPIKSTSTVFHKFQIHPEKLPKYDVQMIGAGDITDKKPKEKFIPSTNDPLQEIFTNNIEACAKESSVIDQDWILATNDKSEDEYTKSNNFIEPALIHVKDSDKTVNDNRNYQTSEPQLMQNQEESVLQFFDALGNTCLSYPGMEIRTNANDFNLDLFSFSNTQ